MSLFKNYILILSLVFLKLKHYLIFRIKKAILIHFKPFQWFLSGFLLSILCYAFKFVSIFVFEMMLSVFRRSDSEGVFENSGEICRCTEAYLERNIGNTAGIMDQ